MKKFFKGLTIFLSILSILILSLICVFYAITFNCNLDEDKLKISQPTITFYDINNDDVTPTFINGFNNSVNIDDLPNYVANSFIAIEDKRFYKHNGIDLTSILRATKNNLFSLSFKEGASTLSQQLIKNTHLSNEKTISRKLKEIKLTMQLEKNYSKKQILNMYLNTVYFGQNAYGIENASKIYFGISASELTLNQAVSLTACVQSPSKNNLVKNADNTLIRKDLVLKAMLNQGLISQKQYQENVNILPQVNNKINNNDYFTACLNELYDSIEISPYDNSNYKVYTYFDKQYQTALKDNFDISAYDKGGIIIGKQGRIKAYYMPSGERQRPPASTLKPLLVYAPAIDLKIISPDSKILDEKTTFGDYSPKNYGDKYNGWVSAKQSLAKSLNIPAVKLLESVGIEKALQYTSKLNIKITDNTLNVALGSYDGGTHLKDLCGGYGIFNNQGYFYPPRFISKIEKVNTVVYKRAVQPVKVISEGASFLVNDMLKESVISGTCKALYGKPYQLCGKTGTNGNKNGNSDAYTICYTSNDIVGLWVGGKQNSLMPNQITGAYVSKFANLILDQIYQNNYPPDFPPCADVEQVTLCRLCYEQGILALQDDNQPSRYTFKGYFLKDNLPTIKSDKISNPKINDVKISVEDNNIILNIDKLDYVKYEITRKNQNGESVTFNEHEKIFEDKNLAQGSYCYTITPYAINSNNDKIYGTSHKINFKIENNNVILDKEWWLE